MAVSQPVSLSALKATARKQGGGINDVLFAALASGMNAYLTADAKTPAALARLQHLTLSASMLVNPRRGGIAMSAERANKLLDDYAKNRAQGCDIVPVLVPLPCGGALDSSSLTFQTALTFHHFAQ